jgi:hypothetical protein
MAEENSSQLAPSPSPGMDAPKHVSHDDAWSAGRLVWKHVRYCVHSSGQMGMLVGAGVVSAVGIMVTDPIRSVGLADGTLEGTLDGASEDSCWRIWNSLLHGLGRRADRRRNPRQKPVVFGTRRGWCRTIIMETSRFVAWLLWCCRCSTI